MPGPQDEIESPGVRTQDGAPGPDSPRAGDRPTPGSVADLRQRQERLQHGHPSSPYDDDGTPKPQLVPLKNLELPLPGEEREPNGSARHDAPPPLAATQRTDDGAAVAKADAGTSTDQETDVQDRQPAIEEPDPARPDREPEAREPEAREAAAPEPEAREAAGWEPAGWEPAASDRQPAQESAWDQRPARESAWAQSSSPHDHAAPEREPAAHDEELAHGGEGDLDDDEPATQDQPAIVDDQAPASIEQSHGRGERLKPEQVRIAVRAHGLCRLAEGRNVFGAYGDTGLTPAMRRVEDQLEHGELVPETEKYALKSLDRFQEKLAGKIADEPDKSAEEHAAEIHDGIRYTFLFDRETYTRDLGVASDSIKEAGFMLIVRGNHWGNDEYKGVNTRWTDPESGVRFEVQFHTQKSWDTKQQSHDAYEKINDPTIPVAEREQLRNYQRELSAEVPLPPGWQNITDYRREGC